MIAWDVRVQGFDARAFTNLIALFAPNVVFRRERDPAGSDAPEIEPLDEASAEREGDEEGAKRAKPDGSLVVVVSREGELLKAFHTVRGRVRDLTLGAPTPDAPFGPLEGLPERYDARRVVAMREGTLAELFERASTRMHREDDYLTQWLHIARAIREELDAGRLAVHPRPLVAIPIPSSALVHRTLDTILPDDHAFVLAVWREHALHTAIAVRRRAGQIDWIAGPDELLAWTGPLGGDWRRDHRVLEEAVAAHVAPVHLGLYGDLRSIRRLLRSRQAGAWVKAVLARDVILHPVPPYVAVALGADAARRVARKSTDLLGSLDPVQRLAPMFSVLRGRILEVASVTQTLGFDPLKLLAQFLEREDPDGAEGDWGADDDEGSLAEDERSEDEWIVGGPFTDQERASEPDEDRDGTVIELRPRSEPPRAPDDEPPTER